MNTFYSAEYGLQKSKMAKNSPGHSELPKQSRSLQEQFLRKTVIKCIGTLRTISILFCYIL